jgi:hypothetical protein
MQIRSSVGNCCRTSPAIIADFSLLQISEQVFYSVLDMYVFRNEASSSTKEGRSFYVGATFVAP